MPHSRKISRLRVGLLGLLRQLRIQAILLAVLVGPNPALVAASATTETSSNTPGSGQRFTPLLPGIWESQPASPNSPNTTFLDLRGDGTGTMVVRLKLARSEQLIISQVAWTVEAGAKDGEAVLRLRYVRSTEPAVKAGTSTERTILDADKRTLRTQNRLRELQIFGRREQLPPEIGAAVAKANWAETTPTVPSEEPKR